MRRKDLDTGLWKRTRLQVLARDGYVCCYCGQKATEVDHVVPPSAGGHQYDTANLVAACGTCNKRKSNRVFLKSHPQPGLPIVSLSDTARTDHPVPFKNGGDNV